MEVHKPQIEFHGPAAEHDVACPIFGPKYHAVLSDGIFQPSWKAQHEGWMTVKAPKWLQKFLRKYQRG
jgi:hypothetical protein